MADVSVEQLQQMIAQQVQQQVHSQQAQPAQQPAQMQAPACGLPSPMMQPAPMGQMPQPVGVSVPVTVPLPDGRELSVRVHFGPDAAANLQQFAAMCMQMFGAYLQARNPWNRGGGWNGRPRNNYGRRW